MSYEPQVYISNSDLLLEFQTHDSALLPVTQLPCTQGCLIIIWCWTWPKASFWHSVMLSDFTLPFLSLPHPRKWHLHSSSCHDQKSVRSCQHHLQKRNQNLITSYGLTATTLIETANVFRLEYYNGLLTGFLALIHELHSISVEKPELSY